MYKISGRRLHYIAAKSKFNWKDRWESTQDYWWEKYLQKKYYGKTKREN